MSVEDATAMECCICNPEQYLRSRQIDYFLNKWKDTMLKQVKVLLLGIAEVGKSTFLKQIKIINGETFSQQDLTRYHAIIIENIITSVQNIVEAMTTLEIPYADPENEINSKMIMDYDWNKEHLDAETGKLIQKLWKDSGLQECFSRRREYYVMESIKYYITERLDDVCSNEYIPTQQDILHCRFPTCGVEEYIVPLGFQDKVLRIVDVGGQRTERQKWVHCFENLDALIFLTAISDYDQVLQEDKTMNRLIESRNLFHKVVNIKWFQLSSTILFLNKIDLFHEKIIDTHLGDFIEEYTGPRGDAEEAHDFIMNFFLSAVENPEKPIYVHDTCATDTESTRVIFTSVKDKIMGNLLNQFHIH